MALLPTAHRMLAPRREAPLLATPLRSTSCASRTRGEQGVVLIWVLMSVLVIAGLVLSGTQRMEAVEGRAKTEWALDGVVYEVARSGLLDGQTWLRRQTTQPVLEFAPKRRGVERPDHLLVPEGGWAEPIVTTDTFEEIIDETDEPSTGLVRAYSLGDELWGLYVLRRGMPAEPFEDEDGDGVYDVGEPFTDVDGNGSWAAAWGTRDVSAERGIDAPGTAWVLLCEAAVYHRPRADLPLGQAPNRRISQTLLAQEVRRLDLRLPADAALVADDGGDMKVLSRGRVVGGSAAALAYAAGTGTPLTVRNSQVVGDQLSVPAYRGAFEDVFGMDYERLLPFADFATDVPDEMPTYLHEGEVVMVRGNVDIRGDAPLEGLGLLIVKGDLHLRPNSESAFRGIIFVDGDVEVKAPSQVHGTIITTGRSKVLGTGGDLAIVAYDREAIDAVLAKVGRYRPVSAPFAPSARLADGRPVEGLIAGIAQHGVPSGVGRLVGPAAFRTQADGASGPSDQE